MAGSKAKRGRPREYDEASVLEAVTDVFWKKGFSGATLPDLSQAAGITRPSLYTALGDKLSMYLCGLAYTKTLVQAQLEITLRNDRPLSECLLEFYRTGIDQYVSGDKPRGCLVVCTATVEAHDEPRIEAMLRDILTIIDKALEKRIKVAIGNKPPHGRLKARHAAKMAAAVLHSLAIRARAGEDRDHLSDLASAATASIILSLEVAEGR